MFRFLPITQRYERGKMYWLRELTALGFVYRPQNIEAGMKIARHHLEAQVSDPVLREKLTPHYTMGCKRVLLSDDFYPAVSQPNVEVITDHIREVKAHSIVTVDGQEHEVDAIICGTGFHVTDTQLPQCVRGHGGRLLSDSWQTGPRAYLGTTVSGFPNMFLLIGQNTGLGHNSMVYMIESQLNYILDALKIIEQRGTRTLDVRPEVQEAFNMEMQQRMKGTVWTSGCMSWYLDARGHNTTLWPGFTFDYRRRTRRFDPQSYELAR